MSTKVCNGCGRELDLSCFKNKNGKPYYNKYKQDKENREHLKEYSRNYQRKRLNINEGKFRGPDQLEKGQTKYTKSQIAKISRYGLTPDKCEVCGSISNLCIDHDHTTGKFRGVLCHSCNLALGHLHDNPEIICKLLNYLEEKKSD